MLVLSVLGVVFGGRIGFKLSKNEKSHFLCEKVEGDIYSMADYNDKKI
jgi:hypothetical protein